LIGSAGSHKIWISSELRSRRQRLSKKRSATRDGLEQHASERPDIRALGQRLAFHELHDEALVSVVLFEAVECGDVRMVELGEEPGFSLETLEPLFVSRELLVQTRCAEESSLAFPATVLRRAHRENS